MAIPAVADPSPRLIFVLPSLVGGGAEFVTKTWAQSLAALGHRVEIVLLRYRDGEPAVEGVHVRRECSASAGRAAEVRALRAILRETDERDVVVSMMTRANLQVLAFRKRGQAKIVISERNIPRAEPGQGRVHIWSRNALFRLLYPRAAAFLAISHPVAAAFYAYAGMRQSATWIVPNPATAKIDVATVVDIAPRVRPLRIVVPARLVDAKRPDLAVQICDALWDRGHELELVFMGDGPLRAAVERVQRPYEVSAPGRVESWYEALDGSTIVLLPSAVEGFGNVLLEAAAVGVPSVVGSNTYGSADALIPGVTGYFARGDSVEAYVAAVEACMQIESRVPRAWLDQFSVSNSVDNLLNCLSTLGFERQADIPGGSSDISAA